MREFNVTNFNELHDVLAQYRENKGWLFRGHSDSSWKLLPKVGRPPYTGTDDRRVFEAWKRRAIEYISMTPETDWDWLAIAQHHGLATRLLDWTTNPLNAAFFAVREQQDVDAVIYAAQIRLQVVTDKVHPMEYKGVAIFRPRGVVPRITRQGGLFTIHGTPTNPLESNTDDIMELQRIKVIRAYRPSLLSELSFYGINSATLFPDLDGLSDFVNWTIRTKEYWKW